MSDALPLLLVDPPWERDARSRREAIAAAAKEAVTVPGLEPPADRSLVWAEGEREEWLKLCDRPVYVSETEKSILEADGWAGLVQAYQDGMFTYTPNHAYLFQVGPEELVRPLLADWNPRSDSGPARDGLKALLARFGLDVRHVVVPSAKAEPYKDGPVLMPLLDVEVARLMADWFVRLKSARRIAREWLTGHGADAVPFLVPDALGKKRVPRDKAKAALSLIASEHGAPAVVEAARRYGDRAAEAIEEILTGESAVARDEKPAAKPVRPLKASWLDQDGLPELRLRDGRVLQREAVGNLIGALTLSPGVRWNRPAEIHPDLPEVLDLCEPTSLAAFGWAVYEAWLAARMPSRNRWVVDQFVWLADDEVVRRLAAEVLKRPGQIGKHATGVLGDIGTDTALFQLQRIARRSKPGLEQTAEQRLAFAAKARGLTAAELADRLVPDLGLDAEGTLVLDYGPRRFTVGFDEALKPFVIDEAGKHRTTLPKPAAKDDDELAPAAYQRFSALKKDVGGVAADQIRRLERSMVTGRRWSADEFRRYFVEHPLLWHIARRLVWTTEDTAFRLAEDRTLADVDDKVARLPETARIGIPHPLELGDAVTEWAEVFADYEVIQPFAQLGRPVDAFTETECRTGRLERFEGATIPSGAVLGLQRRGWERGPVEDGGVYYSIVRRFPGGCPDLVIELLPGVAVTAVDARPEQTLREIGFAEPPGDALDAITASEVLADLSGLA